MSRDPDPSEGTVHEQETEHTPDDVTPLDDDERDLMLYLGILTVSSQLHADPRLCAEALDQIAAEGRSHISYDARDAYLRVAGKVLVHAERAWLRFMAHLPNRAMN